MAQFESDKFEILLDFKVEMSHTNLESLADVQQAGGDRNAQMMFQIPEGCLGVKRGEEMPRTTLSPGTA